MSRETSQWLHDNSLIGDTDVLGNAWWYRKGIDSQGRPNHFPGAVPVDAVLDRIFPVEHEVTARRVSVELPATFETMTHLDDDGNPMRWVVQDNKRGMHRNGTEIVHEIFSAGFQPHQYREWLIENIGTLLDTSAGDLHIHSAGTLAGHAVAYVQLMSDPQGITGQSGMRILPYLLATTSFNGKVASTYKYCNTATVCDNTLDMARAEKTPTVKYRHTKKSINKIGEARRELGIVWENGEDTMAELDRLADTPMPPQMWVKLLDIIHPVKLDGSPNAITMATCVRDRLTAMLHNDPRVNPWDGTALGAFQAFNTYGQHVKATRGKTDRGERNMMDTISGKIGDSDAAVLRAMSLAGITS